MFAANYPKRIFFKEKEFHEVFNFEATEYILTYIIVGLLRILPYHFVESFLRTLDLCTENNQNSLNIFYSNFLEL